MSRVMKSWKALMVLSYETRTIKSMLMRIRQGIFQCDSLSPLLFCIAYSPLSVELRRTGYVYWMTTGCVDTAKRQLVSHLLYIDDLVWQKS